MRFLVTFFCIFTSVLTSAHAAKLFDYQPYEYQVKFTNPICAEYRYSGNVVSNSGNALTAKPKGAYCKPEDALQSERRESSPLFKLVQWIHDPATKEIFFANNSFLNGKVARELCRAIEDRDIKVRFVLDEGADLEQAQELLRCVPISGRDDRKPELLLRGGSASIGKAGNKFFIINASSDQEVRVAFSSGDLSQGVVLNHEAWHFVTTSPHSYFAQAHICLMNGILNASSTATEYNRYIQGCRASIQTPEEEDIHAFFSPGESPRALGFLQSAVDASQKISFAGESFSSGKIAEILRTKLAVGSGTETKLLLDDSVYWDAQGSVSVDATGLNNLHALALLGAKARYVQTNHEMGQVLGNNFVVLEGANSQAVFLSANDLSDIEMSSDFQNMYFISIPEVVNLMKGQFNHLWSDLSSAQEDLPATNVIP